MKGRDSGEEKGKEGERMRGEERKLLFSKLISADSLLFSSKICCSAFGLDCGQGPLGWAYLCLRPQVLGI